MSAPRNSESYSRSLPQALRYFALLLVFSLAWATLRSELDVSLSLVLVFVALPFALLVWRYEDTPKRNAKGSIDIRRSVLTAGSLMWISLAVAATALVSSIALRVKAVDTGDTGSVTVSINQNLPPVAMESMGTNRAGNSTSPMPTLLPAEGPHTASSELSVQASAGSAHPPGQQVSRVYQAGEYIAVRLSGERLQETHKAQGTVAEIAPPILDIRACGRLGNTFLYYHERLSSDELVEAAKANPGVTDVRVLRPGKDFEPPKDPERGWKRGPVRQTCYFQYTRTSPWAGDGPFPWARELPQVVSPLPFRLALRWSESEVALKVLGSLPSIAVCSHKDFAADLARAASDENLLFLNGNSRDRLEETRRSMSYALLGEWANEYGADAEASFGLELRAPMYSDDVREALQRATGRYVRVVTLDPREAWSGSCSPFSTYFSATGPGGLMLAARRPSSK